MRISSGTYKGKKILGPKAITTRPTLQRAKETMFNLIPHQLSKGFVIDVFAGTGQLGLEAMSRGASFLMTNDINKKNQEVLKKNLAILDSNNYRLTKFDYIAFLLSLKNQKIKYIFIDPPFSFAKKAIDQSLKIIDELNLLDENGFIVGEIPFQDEISYIPKNFKLKKNIIFSKVTKIWVYEKI